MPHAKCLRAPLLWTAYLLLPAAGWGVFHGAPVGIYGAVALLAIWWIWIFGESLPGRMMLVALLLIKIAGSLLLIERGMEAEYFANAQWAPPAEQSTDYPGRPFTRIDGRLVFGAPGSPDLPLYFFNDSSRFNFFQPGEPDRNTLPFSATWKGHVWSRAAEDRRALYLRGRGVTAELWVDGAQMVRLEPPAEEALERARWPAGMRRLIVRVSSQPGGGRQFEAGFVDGNGTKTPFSQSELVTRAFAPWRIVSDRIVRFLSVAIDAVLIAMLIYCGGMTLFRAGMRLRRPERRDALVALAWLAGLAGAMLYARPAANHLILLGGGQDYLTYEHYARDIALHGPLMLLGHPLGEAQPFDYQPLYPYFLALAHLLFGEDLSGVYLVQWLLAVGVVLMVWNITATLFGESIGRAGLALAGILCVVKLVPLSGVLLGENLFIPLLTGWTLLMIQMTTPGSTTQTGVRAGLIGGLATLARSTLFAGWVLGLPVLALARRRAGKSLRAVVLMFIIMGVVVSLATLRNAIASHRFVPVGVSINPLGAGTSPGLIAIWWAALIGIGVLMWGRVPDGLQGPVRALPAILGLSQFIIVTLIFPHVYVDRLILPLYILLLPYAALGMMRAVDFLVPPEGE